MGVSNNSAATSTQSAATSGTSAAPANSTTVSSPPSQDNGDSAGIPPPTNNNSDSKPTASIPKVEASNNVNSSPSKTTSTTAVVNTANTTTTKTTASAANTETAKSASESKNTLDGSSNTKPQKAPQETVIEANSSGKVETVTMKSGAPNEANPIETEKPRVASAKSGSYNSNRDNNSADDSSSSANKSIKKKTVDMQPQQASKEVPTINADANHSSTIKSTASSAAFNKNPPDASHGSGTQNNVTGARTLDSQPSGGSQIQSTSNPTTASSNIATQESRGPTANKERVGHRGSNAKSDSNYYNQQHNAFHNKTQLPNHHNNHQNNQQHHSHHNEQLSKTNLYIRGLNEDTSDSQLLEMCSRFGKIVSTKAILDKNTNKCKGYGFVDFETPAAAELAVAELQKQGVLVHMAKQQEADPTNLYIANLPHLMTESELENLLRPFGQVVSTRILINQHRQPRGVGFARMETKEQCDSIIATLNGQIIKGSKEPLLVKFADGASKKRTHHFQHKPLGANAFLGDHMWRNNSNDSGYHMMNSGNASRNFHGGSFPDHSRQNHQMSHHNNGLVKHQMLSSMSGYHPHHQGSGHHSHTSAHHNQHHHSQMQQQHHHGHNHSSHSSHRNQTQGAYSSGSNFPLTTPISGANDASQWLHPPQAGQP